MPPGDEVAAAGQAGGRKCQGRSGSLAVKRRTDHLHRLHPGDGARGVSGGRAGWRRTVEALLAHQLLGEASTLGVRVPECDASVGTSPTFT